jgi:hypothetical protein
MSESRQNLERRYALAQVVEYSVHMEVILRRAFCALIGSKYAAIVAAGQDASWLIDNCRAIVKSHRELSQEGKEAMTEALTACSEAYERRNQLVHGLWNSFDREAEVMVTRRSRRRTFKDVITQWTLHDIQTAGDALRASSEKLIEAIATATGWESMNIWSELVREERQRPSQ